MKRKCTVFIPLFLWINCLMAQNFVKGVIIDQKGKPIALASIYFNNTAIGTVSNYDGSFTLQHHLKSNADLIISHINYDTKLILIEANQNAILSEVLEKKTAELPEITVEPFEKGTWKKWGKLFKEQFLGVTENSKLTTIENTKDIEFRYYKGSNRLVAIGKKPIQIKNKALGYTLQYDMQNFEYFFYQNYCIYSGFVYFKSEENTTEFLEKRKQSFNGSRQHFIMALYQNKLLEEGFDVKRFKKVVNEAKLTLKKEVLNAVDKNKTIVVNSKNSVLSQADSFDIVYSKPLNADSLLIKKHGAVYFNFPNYLSITHKSFLLPIQYDTKSFISKETLLSTAIKLIDHAMVIIYPDGSFYPAEAITNMYRWSITENVANLLPLDYLPSASK